MVNLKARIEATRSQVNRLEAQLTPTRDTGVAEKTLSQSLTKFAELNLEREVAERIYAGAAATLEVTKVASERKLMYLNAFAQPALPETPLYPRRALSIALIVVGSIAAWGALVGGVALARNYMA